MHFLKSSCCVLFLVGCAGGPNPWGGQDGETPFACQRIETSLAFDEVSSLGFSAADVFDTVDITPITSMAYDSGGATELTLGITPETTEVLFVVHEGCGFENLEISGVVDFQSADGAFDEHIEGTLIAPAIDDLRFDKSFHPDDLSGDFTLDTSETAGWSDLDLALSIEFTTSGTNGNLAWQGTQENGEAVMRQSTLIATWETD